MIVLSLKEIIEKSGGGSLDKIFGAFFGILRGGLIVVALSLLGTMTALTEEELGERKNSGVFGVLCNSNNSLSSRICGG